MVQPGVRIGTELIHNGGFKVEDDGIMDTFAAGRFQEKSGEVPRTRRLRVCFELALVVDAMLQEVELPGGLDDLHAGMMSDVDRDDFTHDDQSVCGGGGWGVGVRVEGLCDVGGYV